MASRIPEKPVSPPLCPRPNEQRSYQMVKSELAEVIELIKSATANLPKIGNEKEREIEKEKIEYYKTCAGRLQMELIWKTYR